MYYMYWSYRSHTIKNTIRYYALLFWTAASCNSDVAAHPGDAPQRNNTEAVLAHTGTYWDVPKAAKAGRPER